MGRRIAIGLIGLCLALMLAKALGLRVNESPSLPVGLWRVETPTSPLQRGDVVSVCPPATPIFLEARRRGYLANGECENGMEPLLKPVAGLSGDTVDFGWDGVRINGNLVTNSKPLPLDDHGAELARPPEGRLMLHDDEILLLSSYSARSFDGRYFGPLPKARARFRATPLLVF